MGQYEIMWKKHPFSSLIRASNQQASLLGHIEEYSVFLGRKDRERQRDNTSARRGNLPYCQIGLEILSGEFQRVLVKGILAPIFTSRVWSILEQKACAISHKNVELLKRMLLKCWEEIDAKTLRATCFQVSSRLQHVIYAKRDYIESN